MRVPYDPMTPPAGLMLRRRSDRATLEHPAFAGAVGAVFDHVEDERAHAGRRLTFSDAEEICRVFLVHFIALGGRL